MNVVFPPKRLAFRSPGINLVRVGERLENLRSVRDRSRVHGGKIQMVREGLVRFPHPSANV